MERTITIVEEYDENGNIKKRTETIMEIEPDPVPNEQPPVVIYPWSPTPWYPTYPWPGELTYDPNWGHETIITCGVHVDDTTDLKEISKKLYSFCTSSSLNSKKE